MELNVNEIWDTKKSTGKKKIQDKQIAAYFETSKNF